MHNSRFKKSGDYFRLDIAGFPIILIQRKDGTIQAFHNVCRHRAYPIVNKDSGSSLVLGTSTLHTLRPILKIYYDLLNIICRV
jgi:nitrite reductase/ring-hydroxylating ferredoxin subunit